MNGAGVDWSPLYSLGSYLDESSEVLNVAIRRRRRAALSPSTRALLAEGRVPIRLPQVRNTAEPYRSELWPPIKGNSEGLENLVG